MHGFVNRAFQCFLRDMFGPASWAAVAQSADLGFETFETLADYDAELTEHVVDAASGLLGRPREALFEDMGTYLVSHPNTAALRRLLRFGGASFADFLLSLDELPDRARLALPDLRLPPMELAELAPDSFTLHFRSPVRGGGHVLVGLLRAMADDYGTLAVMEHLGQGRAGEMIGIQLLDQCFAEGRSFALSMTGTGG